ncbi:lipoprotein LpqH [Mycobacterium sp. NPDC050853]|uniref:lipoprotein LpqH n=1 Tax=Mycobacterium sp. NPDC050853 TaxID=3155160 RepID=UPI0033EE7398
MTLPVAGCGPKPPSEAPAPISAVATTSAIPAPLPANFPRSPATIEATFDGNPLTFNDPVCLGFGQETTIGFSTAPQGSSLSLRLDTATSTVDEIQIGVPGRGTYLWKTWSHLPSPPTVVVQGPTYSVSGVVFLNLDPGEPKPIPFTVTATCPAYPNPRQPSTPPAPPAPDPKGPHVDATVDGRLLVDGTDAAYCSREPNGSLRIGVKPALGKPGNSLTFDVKDDAVLSGNVGGALFSYTTRVPADASVTKDGNTFHIKADLYRIDQQKAYDEPHPVELTATCPGL